jgi:hypothetical protein
MKGDIKSTATFAPGGQGALFEKTAPWTVKHPQKLFINRFTMPVGFTIGCFSVIIKTWIS